MFGGCSDGEVAYGLEGTRIGEWDRADVHVLQPDATGRQFVWREVNIASDAEAPEPRSGHSAFVRAAHGRVSLWVMNGRRYIPPTDPHTYAGEQHYGRGDAAHLLLGLE